MGDTMAKCFVCGNEYEIKEVERVYGNTWWKGKYCSAKCYTKAKEKK